MPQTKDVSKYPFVDDADSIYTENWCLNRVGQKEFERSPNESKKQSFIITITLKARFN
jgi:hypothetical protein